MTADRFSLLSAEPWFWRKEFYIVLLELNKVSSMTAQEKVEEFLDDTKESVQDQPQYRREPRESKRGRKKHSKRRQALAPAYEDEMYGDLDSHFQHKPPPSPDEYSPEPEEPPDEKPKKKKEKPAPPPKPAKSKIDKKRKKAFMVRFCYYISGLSERNPRTASFRGR